MTLTELKYLLALAREGHFGRAAKACFVSQPSLSVAIKRLEDELGVAIFERSKSEVKVTEIGQVIIAQAQRILEETSKLQDISKQGHDQLKGVLKLGTIYTIGPYLLPILIPKLTKVAAQMPLFIEEDFTANLAPKLQQGKLDVILISLPFTEPGILTLKVYEEPFVIMLPKQHPLNTKTKLCSEDLKNQNLLLLGEGHCFRDQVVAACPDCFSVPENFKYKNNTTIEGGSLETIRHMVASGFGITIVPMSAIATQGFDKNLVSIKHFIEPAPTRSVALAWRKSFPRPKVITVLEKILRTIQFVA
ncbi:MAG: hydrogen peroxide-inducible genes activator [Pseudomonadota bacterium]